MSLSVHGGTAEGLGGRDLGTLNHWLCLTRFRAAGAVALFALALHGLGARGIAMPAVLSVCGALALFSAIALATKIPARTPLGFFYGQTFVDLAAITVGIGCSADGVPALLFRSIYALVIVPSSFVSVPAGLTAATTATLGHEVLLTAERGVSVATLASLESLVPAFLFYLVAQQSFFYGGHLQRKNTALAALAARLEESRERLAAESRMSAMLVDVARVLGSTLEAPELLARVNRTAHEQLGADWSATFLVDDARATFRLAAVTDADVGSTELGRVDFPLHGWPVLERLAAERVVLLTGIDAGRVPELLSAGRALSTVLLAGFFRDDTMIGFFAVGYGAAPAVARDTALHLLAGIAQHATIALRNAHLLDEVRQASALKSEFVGAVSHELRSPLNVILGYLEMVLDAEMGPLTNDQRYALRRTQRHSVELLEMITALLDLNRLEAGRLPVHRSPVSIGALLEEIRQRLPENWCRPEVELRLEVAADLPVVQTDASKLKTVVRNLVHNALKFTAHGHVTVAATLTRDGEIEITVTDTGPGIPLEAIDYVFDMFRQGPGAGGGGVGLGLHITRRFVETLGGVVRVRSEVGVGSCFTVTLPRTAPAAARSAAEVVRAPLLAADAA